MANTQESDFLNRQVTFDIDTQEKTITVFYYAKWTMTREDYLNAFEQDFDFGGLDLKDKSLVVEMGALPHTNGNSINMYWRCNETCQKDIVRSFTVNHQIANFSPNWDAEFIENDEMMGLTLPLNEVELPDGIMEKIWEYKEYQLEQINHQLVAKEQLEEDVETTVNEQSTDSLVEGLEEVTIEI